jgi:O-acetyl-ADP-ribose deacetylase
MAPSPTPVVTASAPRGEAALILEEHDSLAELEAELEHTLSSGETALVLDFRAKPGHPFTAIDAYQVLLEHLARRARDGAVHVHVSSEKIAERLSRFSAPSESPSKRRAFGGVTVTLHHGSILEPAADALVNASNTRLVLGSGVSGALRRACGPALQEAMSRIGGVAQDGYAVTPAFAHGRVREIIHVPSVSGSEAVITRAYENVLRRAIEAGHSRVLVPALGAGVGGMSFEATARALRRAVESEREAHELELVVTVIDAPALEAFARVFEM